MGLTLVTPPAVEPVSLADAKAWARIDHDAEDAVLELMIRAAREWCEHYQARRLINSTWMWTLDRFPCDVLEPAFSPLVSVDAITYVDETGNTRTLDPSRYQVDTTSEPGRIVPAYGTSWPSARWQPAAITVRYTAGYGAEPNCVPASTRLGLLKLVAYWHENREAAAAGEVPAGVLAELDNERIIRL